MCIYPVGKIPILALSKITSIAWQQELCIRSQKVWFIGHTKFKCFSCRTAKCSITQERHAQEPTSSCNNKGKGLISGATKNECTVFSFL